MINHYYPVISQWDDVKFVTLTVKSSKEEKLNRWVYGLLRAFELIKNRCNKKYQRGKGIKLIGVKSLECNFNPEKKNLQSTFSPYRTKQRNSRVAQKRMAGTVATKEQK